jgi:SAM-dependent methyltransferase
LPTFPAAHDRERQDPVPGDDFYVHLRDLRDILRPRLEHAEGLWLDYGAGTAPYRVFMPNARLALADMPGDNEASAPHLDYVLEPGLPCPAADETFDGVLSTQVLEHVPDPGAYLGDSFRMLRPGGELLLTTHGTWEEHPCPVDLSRWTVQGLRDEVKQAGFDVVECMPVTCGVRAALFLLTRELLRTSWRSRYRSLNGLLLGTLREVARRRPAALHRYADRALSDQRTGQEAVDKLYLDVLVTARKPE